MPYPPREVTPKERRLIAELEQAAVEFRQADAEHKRKYQNMCERIRRANQGGISAMRMTPIVELSESQVLRIINKQQ